MPKLENRRAELVEVQDLIRKAEDGLAAVEAQVAAAKGSRTDAKRRLADAEKLVERLRDEVKQAGRRRETLKAQAERDHTSLRRLERKAREVESRYDRAVLTDLVEREKQRDLATVTSAGASAATATAAPAETFRVTEQDVPGETVRVVDHTAGTETVTRTPVRAGTRTRAPKAPAAPTPARREP